MKKIVWVPLVLSFVLLISFSPALAFENAFQPALQDVSAFEDPRFPPVSAGEAGELDVEISVMGPLTPCPDPELIEIGRHGLYIRKSIHAGLLLPQVAVEQGWDRETFLDQTCVKAGLPKGSWRKPKTEIWWFEAVIF